MADNVVGIKFGVAGGKSISGESGSLIKSQLESIASKIQLKINVNKTYFASQLSLLRKELDKTLGNLNINIRANTQAANSKSGASSDVAATKEQAVTYESVRKAIERLYQAKSRLVKLSETDKSGTVRGVLLLDQARELETQYNSQFHALQEKLGAESEEIRKIETLRGSLEAARAAQEELLKTPVLATGLSLNKLKTKAASLYVDNGFDKIIARSKEASKLVNDFNNNVNIAFGNSDKTTREEVQKLNEEFLRVQGRLKEIARETNNTKNKIKDAFDSRVIQRVAQMLLLLMVRALKQVYENVKEINTAMTELQIVTMATSNQMKKAADDIARSAKEIGASIADLTKSTTIYARLGYDLTDAKTLAEKTTIYARVAGVNVNEATNNITGIIKAFDIGANGLESVLDQMIWIGNNFPISQAEIGEAMNNAASALVANGNTLQEAIAIVTAANTTIQDVSKSSTAVRTIAARIARSDAELEALGEDSGSVMSTARLQEQMNAFGVSIVNANGELRSTYDILADVAAIWDEINTVDRAAIAEMLAGTRQQSAFYSIIQNWEDAQKVVTESGKAAGALMDAQEVRLDSIEGKLERLKATWEDFSTNVLNSGLVKGFIDILMGLAKALDAITSILDGFIPKTASAGAFIMIAISLIKKLHKAILAVTGATTWSLKTIKATFLSFTAKVGPTLMISAVIAAMTTLEGRSRALTELIVAAIGIIVAAIIFGIKGIDTAIKGFMATNPIGWILAAISVVISALKGIYDLIESYNPSYETLKEQAQDSIDAWKKAEDELDSVKDKLEEVGNKIDELDEKDKLSLIDKEQLEYLERERANLKSIQAEMETEAKRAKEQAAADAAATLGKYNDTKTVEKSKWWYIFIPFASAIQDMRSEFSESVEEKFTRILQDYQNASEEDKNFISEILKQYGELTDGFSFGDNEELDKYLRQYYNILDRYNLQTGKAEVVFDRVFNDARFADEVNNLKELANGQAVTLQSIVEAAPEFLSYLKEIGAYTDGDTKSADALIVSIKGLRDVLEKKTKITFTDDIDIMQDKLDSLDKALQDIEENGVISMENISKIIDKDAEGYPSYLEKYFKYIDGVGYTLADIWKNSLKGDLFSEMAKDDLQRYVNELARAQDVLTGMSEDDEDYKTALENVAIAQDNLNVKTTQWAVLLREQKIKEETDKLEGLKDSLEDQADQYKKLIDIRKKLLETYKEELDQQKELEKRQKSVADLRSQLAVARLDTSASGQTRVRELEEKLKEAQEDLDEYTLERAIDDITNSMDKDYEEYKSFIDDEIERLERAIKDLPNNIKVSIEHPEAQPEERPVPTEKEEKHSPWRSYQDAVDDGFSNIAGASKSERSRIRNQINPYTGENYKSYQEYLDAMYRKYIGEYHTGGLVGGVSSLRSNEEFAKLLKGEFVSTPRQMDRFMRETLPNVISSSRGSAGPSIINNTPLIEIRCGNIEESTMPKLKDVVNQAVEKIAMNMEGALSRAGYKHRV